MAASVKPSAKPSVSSAKPSVSSTAGRPSVSFLKRFQLDGIHDTGRRVGDGAYATVMEYDYRGLKCVGKKIHLLLYESATAAERDEMLRRFEAECELLSQLHHPNIVQFLGVHVEASSELPALVMEHLSINLSDCLESRGVLPPAKSLSILHDVALGLRYLHEQRPPIVHRDLSANNILLTEHDLSAKIADLGVAKILNLSPTDMHTPVPGTPCYMPPEALAAHFAYDSKIDCFSFGVLILHVLCAQWPIPTNLFVPDLGNPGTLIPVTEIGRREEYLQQIGTSHPLSHLACQCLSNIPAQRPVAEEIFHAIKTVEVHETRQPSSSTDDTDEVVTLHDATAEIYRLRSALLEANTEIERLKNDSPTEKDTMAWFFHPRTRIEWTQLPNAPVEMYRAQVVVMGDEMCIGGGVTLTEINPYLAFQYNWKQRTWRTLPICPVKLFAMANFNGSLITVGGTGHVEPIGNVYRLSDDTMLWEEYLVPMPTARYQLSVATTSHTVVAAGGVTDVVEAAVVHCSTVEIYFDSTRQWHTTEPLLAAGHALPSITVGDAFYVLGAMTTANSCAFASLSSLLQKAVSPAPSTPSRGAEKPLWKPLSHPPIPKSSLTCMGGVALTIIGGAVDGNRKSPAVHVFLPLANSWVKLERGHLPIGLSALTAVQVSPREVIVVGGLDENNYLSRVAFLGTIYTDQ